MDPFLVHHHKHFPFALFMSQKEAQKHSKDPWISMKGSIQMKLLMMGINDTINGQINPIIIKYWPNNWDDREQYKFMWLFPSSKS